MIMKRMRIIVGDAGFEPEVWCAAKMSHHISNKYVLYLNHYFLSSCPKRTVTEKQKKRIRNEAGSVAILPKCL